jgi:glucosamine--fructose-6-phosphate aminotransferase (isomerizing)
LANYTKKPPQPKEHNQLLTKNIALGHTRWATHGKVEERNTHPHVSNSGRFVLVHNGIFENYLEVKKELQKKGYKFYSETDTEVFVNWLESEVGKSKNVFKIFESLVKKVRGANAFVVLDKETENIFLFKNGSPLFVGKSKTDFYISSDMSVFPGDVEYFYEVKDKESLSLEFFSTKNKKYKWVKYVEENESKTNTLYPHFMLKEIFDQKASIKNAYKTNKNLKEILGKTWFKNKKIFATGCGTAYNAANIFALKAAEQNIFVKAVPGNEWEQIEHLIDKDSILFCFSQSGETVDLLLLAKKFKVRGGKVFSILNREFSSLKNISDKCFFINSGKEIAVASTKAFTGMIAVTYKLLDIKLSEKDFIAIENFLFDYKKFSKMDTIIERFKDSKSIFVLGKNFENFLALETALKIKEVSYIHTEGFASGELKHGVIALIETKILSIVLGGDQKYFSDLDNSITQITSRGGEVLYVGTKDSPGATYNFLVPNEEKVAPILGAILGQILAYKFAISRGLNPDKPRNLAKSVTVK